MKRWNIGTIKWKNKQIWELNHSWAWILRSFIPIPGTPDPDRRLTLRLNLVWHENKILFNGSEIGNIIFITHVWESNFAGPAYLPIVGRMPSQTCDSSIPSKMPFSHTCSRNILPFISNIIRKKTFPRDSLFSLSKILKNAHCIEANTTCCLEPLFFIQNIWVLTPYYSPANLWLTVLYI